MSRAFVKEDGDEAPQLRFTLPSRRSPGFNAAAAAALLEGAWHGDTAAAELATGLRWGDPSLRAEVERILQAEESRPEPDQDRRLLTVARRYLKASTSR